jgi:putative transposase
VPSHLKRYYGHDDLHFITFSCYQRRRLLGTAHRRDLFLKLLEHVRRHYEFVVVGYVVMPEHVHLLISEPEHGTPSVVTQVVKQEFAKKVIRSLRARTDSRRSLLWANALEAKHIWQARFYDFNVWSDKKRVEKLRYMHRNPVRRGLVRESTKNGVGVASVTMHLASVGPYWSINGDQLCLRSKGRRYSKGRAYKLADARTPPVAKNATNGAPVVSSP